MDLVRDIGDRYAEGEILMHLGDTHEASGNPAAARRAWTEALHILSDLGHADAHGIQAKLDALPA